MPSSTGRHTLRKNLREVKHYGDDSDEGITTNGYGGSAISNDDDINGDRRVTFATSHISADEDEDIKPPSIRRHSSSLMDALSDENSELAHFLLAKNNNDEDEDHGLFDGLFESRILDGGLMKSVRNLANRVVTGEYEVNEVKSMGTSKAWFYSLALEPMEVRRDRIIMLAEAYAIFGALFLSGTWVLYEWGSSMAYGGCNGDSDFGCHPAINRAFELVMSLCITANVFQAMFASFLWLMSILFSGSHRNWVYGARNLLLLCHILLTCIFVFVSVGVALGVYIKFVPKWPELAISLSFFLVVLSYGMWAASNLAAEEISLEYYHFPMWFKWGIFPYPMLRRGGRQKIRKAAEARAKELKARAFQERSRLDPASSKSRRVSRTSVGKLLRRSADSIGRSDFDVSKYEARLEEDWYNDVSEIGNLSVEILSKYMPRRLAEEVHNQLALDKLNKEGGMRSSHIASGVYVGNGNESRVSWKMEDTDSD